MKKKIVVLIGMAVCILFLTSPVLASAGYSKIYGNANEDDVLDMRDVTYIKLVIFGKKPATDFADANNDGKVSMLDVGQAKLIILGKEKQLTLIDQADRTVTVNMPVEKVVTLTPEASRLMVALGAVDRLVGIEQWSLKNDWSFTKFLEIHPEVSERVADIGMYNDLNLEEIVYLKPDVIFHSSQEDANIVQEKTTSPVIVVCSNFRRERVIDEIEIMGKLVDNEKKAEELISYINEKIAEVTDVTSEIPDEEKVKVYLAFWSSITKTPAYYDPVDLAGGINVAKECPTSGYSVEISKEQIVAWNPDIILIHHASTTYGIPKEDILSDPALQTVNAVKTGKVYYTPGPWFWWEQPRAITECFYMAKLFYPDKFEDLNVEEEGNEIFDKFWGIDGLWTELGTELGYI